ncbi:MAG: imidazoleglycerol-phosphate dehydratase HisB [Ferrimicrobium sp.]
MSAREGRVVRSTAETSIEVTVHLDDPAPVTIETPVPFFTHMLNQLGTHGRMGMLLRASGDVEVDAHHLVEDVGIALGKALREAIGEARGIERFASTRIPLDEALVEVTLDCSGRGMCIAELRGERSLALGSPAFYLEHAEEFLRALALHGGVTLHIQCVRGVNTHHILEATFKGLGRALFAATRVVGQTVPSTKGVLGG